MKVFKFGGASIKNADAIVNVGTLVQAYENQNVILVVSAMGKTTNAFEGILESLLAKKEANFFHQLEALKEFHLLIAGGLFREKQHKVFQMIEITFDALADRFTHSVSDHPGFEYDQIISTGEMLSAYLLTEYLIELGLRCEWMDARQLIRTDNHYQEGNVQWEKTEALIQQKIKDIEHRSNIFVTQGFVGHTAEGFTTTLGREGSDYSAAIYAYCTNSESVTIWKDVPGMLNADPKYFEKTKLLPIISYKEAIELAYFGASVIHPKTIKPLQNKNIPLYVKSFLEPNAAGTTIQEEGDRDHLIPSFIVKKNQILISISATDFSFINEDALAKIFDIFYDARIKINLMQNSALNFSTLVDADKLEIDTLIQRLSPNYKCKYNTPVELVTIRHYDDHTIRQITQDKEILIAQRSRQTARFVLRG
jgi:aspartate kinase